MDGRVDAVRANAKQSLLRRPDPYIPYDRYNSLCYDMEGQGDMYNRL